MAGFETIIYEKQGPVAHLSLARPRVLNAYNTQMRDDFSEALSAAAEDPEAKVLLVTGQGRAFCAGADLTEFGSAPSQDIARRVRWQRDVWGQFLALDRPVVAAIHGHCIGSGVEIALLSDLRLAASDAVFALPEVQLGMIPAAGGTQTLPRSVGPAAALDLLLTGRRLDAAEALRLGLVTRVAQPEELEGAAWALARQLAGGDFAAASAAKRGIMGGGDLGLAEGLALEARLASLALGWE